MAAADFHPQRLEVPRQPLVPDAASPAPQSQAKPSRFHLHFLYKALSVAIVLVIIPLFPSQAPEFVNQTILTRGWELFHLLFVGIAVSYGLFSRRNVETEKDFQFKTDTNQACVSRILQVSSVFDDEVEGPSLSDVNKIQPWSSQYFRGEPAVVVAKENSIFYEHGNAGSYSSYKPLFLPVRSLRSPVSDRESVGSVSETGGSWGSLSRSASDSRIGSSNSSDRSGRREIGDLGPLNLEEKLKESVVLPSPIPWRSRSGRMEMREEVAAVTPPQYSPPSSAKESDFDQHKFPSFHSPIHRTSQPNSASPSPKRLSPSHSLSPEFQAKNMEELGKKNTICKCSPPPATPLPNPESPKSPMFELHSNSAMAGFSSEKKHVKSDMNNELRDLSRRRRDELRNRRNFRLDSLKSESKSRTHVEGPPIGKSVRTFRPSESVSRARSFRETDGPVDGKTGGMSDEVETMLMEETRMKKGGADQFQVNREKQNCEMSSVAQNSEIVHPTSKPKSSHQKKEMVRRVILETEEYSSSENESVQQSSGTEETVSDSDAGQHPSEVDKKADEFIAKFREQIRLQRIDSIKRSSRQGRGRNSSQ